MSECAYTAENVDTVNDLVLSYKGALKCIKPRVKLQGAYTLGVVKNTIYVLLKISSGMLVPKIMKIGSRITKLLQK